MYRPLRVFWNLVAVGGATAVGVTTRDAGFVTITFLGGLVLPRMLGLAGPGRWNRHGRDGRSCFASKTHGGWRAERFAAWHREQHGQPSEPAPSPGPAQI